MSRSLFDWYCDSLTSKSRISHFPLKYTATVLAFGSSHDFEPSDVAWIPVTSNNMADCVFFFGGKIQRFYFFSRLSLFPGFIIPSILLVCTTIFCGMLFHGVSTIRVQNAKFVRLTGQHICLLNN